MSELHNCHDCGAKPGELHMDGCDTERCAMCGGQTITCDCVYKVNCMDPAFLEILHPDIYENGATEEMYKVFDAEIAKLGGRLPWTGIWPGEVECIEFGWYSRWVDGEGWVSCGKDDEGAGPDLNRLMSFALWDARARRWVLP